MGAKRDFALIKHGHLLSELDDLDITSPADNSVLQYDSASGTWQDVSISSFNSQLDHGLLLGLADDDHTQYHTDARALTWLGTRSTADLPEGSNLYFTDERAQDAVGTVLIDSTSIDFTYNDGSNTITASTINANPTGTIGLTAVNGSAATPMRSDATPALSQAIVPSWTGMHSFQAVGNGGSSASLELRSTRPQLNYYDTNGTAGNKAGGVDFSSGDQTFFVDDDTFTSRFNWLVTSRNGATMQDVFLNYSRNFDLATGKLRLTSDNQEIQLGASQDLRLYHDGTDSYINNGTGALRFPGSGGTIIGPYNGNHMELQSSTSTYGWRISTNSAGEIPLSIEKKTAGAYTEVFRISNDTSNVKLLLDNQELQIGASQDLRLYHDGTDSYIENDTGNLILKVNGELKVDEVTTGTTAPAAGGAGALPATPTGYMTLFINGTSRQIAYY